MTRHLRLSAMFALALTTFATAQPAKEAPKPAAQPATAAKADAAPVKHDFAIEGVYVEACTCKSACAAELTGDQPGCNGVGAMRIDKGTYDGKDISGCKVAFSCKGDSAHLYIDAPEAKKAAAEAFARASMAGFGNFKSVTAAKIDLDGKNGAYTVKVDSGKTFSLTTKPAMGGDGKTPVEIKNTQHPLNSSLFQGRCIAASCSAGEDSFTIEKGRNSFFNATMKASGKI